MLQRADNKIGQLSALELEETVILGKDEIFRTLNRPQFS